MQNLKLGFAFCGSFCTINKSLEALKELAKLDIDLEPQIYFSQILMHKNRWVSPFMQGLIDIINADRPATER